MAGPYLGTETLASASGCWDSLTVRICHELSAISGPITPPLTGPGSFLLQKGSLTQGPDAAQLSSPGNSPLCLLDAPGETAGF